MHARVTEHPFHTRDADWDKDREALARHPRRGICARTGASQAGAGRASDKSYKDARNGRQTNCRACAMLSLSPPGRSGRPQGRRSRGPQGLTRQPSTATSPRGKERPGAFSPTLASPSHRPLQSPSARSFPPMCFASSAKGGTLRLGCRVSAPSLFFLCRFRSNRFAAPAPVAMRARRSILCYSPAFNRKLELARCRTRRSS